ncbi:twin-arginine translocase TatA/TatE family subunit [Oscillochloris sp. ZM17-4]|uniref:twin-arginine translocase TatA/TatE family subunit n=1 Tax=Oscillochloris sp. ZM17-4 TaxID=2866714 RepID=UPI001C733CF4|nr:twin-arginine translocase TatA/TatE family subunit [Oscillochloris sp. ZM17-4]MBX0329310.1 twin-arginine translocase TatA/TatE family subunit [Oscillochloris sp. ZM17-4]
MEIFNVGIPELMMIAGLALVVFGPERLPEVGRFLGKQVARVLAWQQNSPELQMLNEVRGEFEAEIASLRDELVRTRKQLDVSKDITAIKEELRPMLDLRGSVNGLAPAAAANGAEPTIAPPRPADALSPVEVAPAETVAAPAATPTLSPTPASQTVPAAARPTKLVAAEPTDVFAPLRPAAEPIVEPAPDRAAEASPGADEQIALRIQQIAADLQALMAELQARGQLGPDWQPPSQTHEQEAVSS